MFCAYTRPRYQDHWSSGFGVCHIPNHTAVSVIDSRMSYVSGIMHGNECYFGTFEIKVFLPTAGKTKRYSVTRI